jgi:hypothetical protein
MCESALRRPVTTLDCVMLKDYSMHNAWRCAFSLTSGWVESLPNIKMKKGMVLISAPRARNTYFLEGCDFQYGRIPSCYFFKQTNRLHGAEFFLRSQHFSS